MAYFIYNLLLSLSFFNFKLLAYTVHSVILKCLSQDRRAPSEIFTKVENNLFLNFKRGTVHRTGLFISSYCSIFPNFDCFSYPWLKDRKILLFFLGNMFEKFALADQRKLANEKKSKREEDAAKKEGEKVQKGNEMEADEATVDQANEEKTVENGTTEPAST